jgi:hypothetical protein
MDTADGEYRFDTAALSTHSAFFPFPICHSPKRRHVTPLSRSSLQSFALLRCPVSLLINSNSTGQTRRRQPIPVVAHPRQENRMEGKWRVEIWMQQ